MTSFYFGLKPSIGTHCSKTNINREILQHQTHLVNSINHAVAVRVDGTAKVIVALATGRGVGGVDRGHGVMNVVLTVDGTIALIDTIENSIL